MVRGPVRECVMNGSIRFNPNFAWRSVGVDGIPPLSMGTLLVVLTGVSAAERLNSGGIAESNTSSLLGMECFLFFIC